ncbi:hypothetical protein QYE76_041234 [Lolium multiflorum]|uniref:histidine kinase n=1 Tax=Lolium multiflorum TaxID=4521 RepID=A0AAD8WVR8_LOLMU|nr:hypothetical protein QYE76_041234 [Lolium multiflorum]
MPCRPHSQGISSTRLVPGAAAPASTHGRPAPHANLPPSPGRCGTNARTTKRRAAAPPSMRHGSPLPGLAGANNGSLPHAVAHHGHRDTDEAGSSLHATVAPRHPKIRRPPRNLRAEAKPAAPNPSTTASPGPPPRRASAGEHQLRAGPDRALPGPVPAPARQRRTSPPPMPHVAAPATSHASARPRSSPPSPDLARTEELEHPPTTLRPWHCPHSHHGRRTCRRCPGPPPRRPCSAASSPPSRASRRSSRRPPRTREEGPPPPATRRALPAGCAWRRRGEQTEEVDGSGAELGRPCRLPGSDADEEVRLMGGEISIKNKELGEAGTCFGFNVFLKISDAEEDIEHGRAAPSVFREPGCFKGGQCVLLVHGDETRRILQTWMENVGMKVWPIRRAELLAPTMEKARAAVGASPSRPASISSSQGGGDDLDGVADRCFSSKEMVTQVLRNNSGNHAGHLHPFGLLVVVDVSGGRLNEILQEAPSLARIKHQVPCRVACITDLKTSSEDLRRLKEAASCDMDLRKPIHGSRLRKLLQVMRELQASLFPQQHSHQVGFTINELPAADQATAASCEITSAAAVPQEPLEATAASSETTSAAAVPQEPPKLEDDKPLEGKRVLLVEDTRVLQFIQKKMLSTLGATVVVAADGSEAVAMFIHALEIASGGVSSEEWVALPYDVIFMDCQMPVMDGYEATKRIREEESRYGIRTPIIALTAHSEEEDLQKTIQAGMDLHLTKPIQKEKVVDVVHRVWKEDLNDNATKDKTFRQTI